MPTTQTPQVSSLSKEFFTELIKLEADFHKKAYTLETLNELTQYYARAVEFYDAVKDNISCYFIFKIQDILATKQSLVLLSKEKQREENKDDSILKEEISKIEKVKSYEPKSFVLKSPIFKVECEDGKVEEEVKERLKSKPPEIETITKLRNQKQRFVHLFYKLENQMVSEKENMEVALSKFKNSKERNDEFVKSDLDKQKYRIRERLNKKKNESFASQMLNTISFQSINRNPLALSNIEQENFLEFLSEGSAEETFQTNPFPKNGIDEDTNYHNRDKS